MAILIKRYANRKLYNTETSRYITLKGIATILDEGGSVRVVDNETGEDITQVALSQILVDNQRAREDPSDTLISQILTRGGDALYGAIRKSVDDATEGLGEFQDRFRRIVEQSDPGFRRGRAFPWERWSAESRPSSDQNDEPEEMDDDAPHGVDRSDPFERLDPDVRESLVDILNTLELPRRRDVAHLNRNLERVATAIERLEAALLRNERD
jgi:polyhydroxyalkanoate synthesis repressor PhaR